MRLRRLNQSQVATYIGMRPSGVNVWFSRGSIPNPQTCIKLAEFLKVPAETVLRLAGHLPPEDEPSFAELAHEPAEYTQAEHIVDALLRDTRKLKLWLEMGQALADE